MSDRCRGQGYCLTGSPKILWLPQDTHWRAPEAEANTAALDILGKLAT
jgi:hypothetical protein